MEDPSAEHSSTWSFRAAVLTNVTCFWREPFVGKYAVDLAIIPMGDFGTITLFGKVGDQRIGRYLGLGCSWNGRIDSASFIFSHLDLQFATANVDRVDHL